MAIIGIFGIVNDKFGKNLGSIRGGGKTATGMDIGKESVDNGKPLITNFHTSISEYMPFEEIAVQLYNENLTKSCVIIDEVHVFFNSMDKDPDEIKFAEDLCGQSRKLQNDLVLIDQRFESMHLRLRVHCDVMLRPFKIHETMEVCPLADCTKHHIIVVSAFYPVEAIVKFFDINDVKDLYNTNEVIKRTNDERLRDYIPYLRKGKKKERKKKDEDDE